MSTLPTPAFDMETSALAASSAGEAERGRLREFLASQQRRWSEAELQLLEQVEDLLGRLSAGDAAAGTEAAATAARQECDQRRAAEVEALKARIAELERQLAQGQTSSRGPAGTVLDWEAEKCRILAALELEVSGDDEAAPQRLEMQQVVRTTDAVVAEKQRRDRAVAGPVDGAEQQPGLGGRGSGRFGPVVGPGRDHSPRAGHAEATARAMAGETSPGGDRDLDGAAQIARQKAELDARCRALALPAAVDDAGGRKLGDRPPRGQWLARLGLKSLDEH